MQFAGEEEQYMKLINPMKVNRSEWEEFVYNHPKGNIFQSPHLAEVFERAKGIEPIALAAIDEDSGEIFASLLAYVLKYTNVLSSFASRARIRGGPLFLNTEKGILAAKMLLKHYDGVIRRKALYTDIWNLWDVSNLPASALIRDAGYVYDGYLNFLVDLAKSKEELWADIRKSKRRAIRKAKEKGVYIEEAKDCHSVVSFYSALKETYTRAKIPLEDISFLKSAFDILAPKNMLKLFLIKYKDECIGGMIAPVYKGVIYGLYVCGSRTRSKLFPSEMVTWHTIEWGSENGCHTFDFLGAGKPNEEYGVREFKKGFAEENHEGESNESMV